MNSSQAMLALLALFAVPAGAAQDKAGKVTFPEDAVLKKLEAALPARWHMRREKDRLIVEGGSPLWEVYYNRINAPATWGEDAKRQWEEMKKTTPPRQGQFAFRLEPRWPAAKMTDAVKQNEALRSEAAKRAPAPPAEPSKAAWADARGREAELEEKLTRLPCNTQRYSLFFAEQHGIESEQLVVFPAEAGREAWAVREILARELAPCEMGR